MAKAKSKKKTAKKAAKKKTTKKLTKKKTKKMTKKSSKKKTAKKATKKAVRKIAKSRTASTKTAATTTTAMTAASDTRISEGQMAPDFTLKNQNGEMVTLSSFKGKNVILYFYPKDDTPGCTKEACSLRDHIGSIDQQNAIVFGVSFDDESSHQAFINKYGLNFQLLCDTDKKVANDYGVYVQKNMYGKISMGIERSTFWINADGMIAKAWRRVQVDGHTEEILAALRQAA